MEDAYLSKIEGYCGQPIEFRSESQTERYAQVHSLAAPPNGIEPIQVDYQFKQDGSDWKAYNVAVDNICMNENYRNQLTVLFQDQSYDALVKVLRAKQRELSRNSRNLLLRSPRVSLQSPTRTSQKLTSIE